MSIESRRQEDLGSEHTFEPLVSVVLVNKDIVYFQVSLARRFVEHSERCSLL